MQQSFLQFDPVNSGRYFEMAVLAKCLDAEASSILLLHKLFHFVAFRFQPGSWDLKRLIETTTVDKVTYLNSSTR